MHGFRNNEKQAVKKRGGGVSAHLSAMTVERRVFEIEHDCISARAIGRLTSDESGCLVSVRLRKDADMSDMRHACSRAEDAMWRGMSMGR